MTIAIIIPARFGSTRFPGKPLAMLQGAPMLEHVYNKAKQASAHIDSVKLAIATDDERIQSFCNDKGFDVIMTSPDCPTGSDRVIEAALKMGLNPDDILINLQGDAPFVPTEAIRSVIDAFKDSTVNVATPVRQLRWGELDILRDNKKTTPFSGTTATIKANGNALWFSKNILPAIRKEDQLRTQSEFSPVHQHLGLYGYRLSALQAFSTLPEGTYEALEGLEQLRFLENDMPIRLVKISANLPVMSGIDSPQDLARAQNIPL